MYNGSILEAYLVEDMHVDTAMLPIAVSNKARTIASPIMIKLQAPLIPVTDKSVRNKIQISKSSSLLTLYSLLT